jgi:NAD(P)H dehydrogenase (quinone)
MSTVSILYFSGTGHTAKLAEAVAKGASSVPDVKANQIAINGGDIVKGRYANDAVFTQLDASDAIIFGSPTYMGGAAAQFKAFADATGDRWHRRAWLDKVAAGFTISNGLNGDKLSTLHYLFTFAVQHGMIWVGFPDTPNDNGVNRLSSYSGVMALAGQEPVDVAPNEADKLTGEILGRRVAVIAAKLKA